MTSATEAPMAFSCPMCPSDEHWHYCEPKHFDAYELADGRPWMVFYCDECAAWFENGCRDRDEMEYVGGKQIPWSEVWEMVPEKLQRAYGVEAVK